MGILHLNDRSASSKYNVFDLANVWWLSSRWPLYSLFRRGNLVLTLLLFTITVFEDVTSYKTKDQLIILSDKKVREECSTCYLYSVTSSRAESMSLFCTYFVRPCRLVPAPWLLSLRQMRSTQTILNLIVSPNSLKFFVKWATYCTVKENQIRNWNLQTWLPFVLKNKWCMAICSATARHQTRKGCCAAEHDLDSLGQAIWDCCSKMKSGHLSSLVVHEICSAFSGNLFLGEFPRDYISNLPYLRGCCCRELNHSSKFQDMFYEIISSSIESLSAKLTSRESDEVVLAIPFVLRPAKDLTIRERGRDEQRRIPLLSYTEQWTGSWLSWRRPTSFRPHLRYHRLLRVRPSFSLMTTDGCWLNDGYYAMKISCH